MKKLLALVFLLVSGGIVFAHYEPQAINEWDSNSPDGLYLAAFRIIPNERLIWREDYDSARIMIVRLNYDNGDDDPKKETYVSYDISRLIARIAWSPDSKYLVMTTVSPGGHSPWHFQSYVYCVNDKSLRDIDSVTGPIIDENFKFVSPHSVEMTITSHDEVSATPVTITIDLMKKARQMKKLGTRKEGNVWD
jgi:hypothetical protein